MGEDGSIFSTLLDVLERAIRSFPDKRTGKNIHYSMRDGALSGFSVFFIQCPSFLSHQVLMQQEEGNNNARTLFGVEEIPTDQQIRNLLDPVDPKYCFPVFKDVRLLIEQWGLLEQQYQSSLGSYLLALDATWFHNSEVIHCAKCSHKDHQDRQKKQDCETNAAKRWLAGSGSQYVSMGITLLGDDLYCSQPFCCDALAGGYHFILTCESSSHKYLSEWIEAADVGVDIEQVIIKRWTGKERLYYRYRFMNDVRLKEGKDALRVNWCELVILDKEGNERKRFGFATDYLITRENVIDLVECGRSRWKIENENNNTLKTKGYNLEHNFGHGVENLSNLLLTFNIIAFLLHTVLEFFDKRYALLRKSLRRRKTFFEDIRALTRYWCFEGWAWLVV